MLSLYEEFPDDPTITSLLSGEPVEFAFIPSVTPGRCEYPLRYSPPKKGVQEVFHYGIAARKLPDRELLNHEVFFLYPEWSEADAESAMVDRREMEDLQPFKVYRARGTYYQTTIAIQHRFNIHELLPAKPDPELDELAVPVVLDTPLGSMEFDRQFSCFTGRDPSTNISIWTEYAGDKLLIAGKTKVQRTFASAVKFLKEVYSPDYLDRARRFASEAVLHRANQWRYDVAEAEGRPTPTPKWTAEQVYERLTPSSIVIPQRGNVVVEFDDGYLFGGHPIEISTSRSGEPKKVQ